MTDQLKLLRRTASQMRDLSNEIADLEEQVAEKKKQLWDLQHEKLPDLFSEAGVDELALAAEGNHSSATFKLKPFYRACIAVSWPAEKRKAAFDHLDKLGFGDVIKRTYRINLARGEKTMATKLEKDLDRLGLSYSANLDVHASTLTSLLREQFESGNKKLDLDKIGGQAGMIVELK